jgi:hypothetical protein
MAAAESEVEVLLLDVVAAPAAGQIRFWLPSFQASASPTVGHFDLKAASA